MAPVARARRGGFVEVGRLHRLRAQARRRPRPRALLCSSGMAGKLSKLARRDHDDPLDAVEGRSGDARRAHPRGRRRRGAGRRGGRRRTPRATPTSCGARRGSAAAGDALCARAADNLGALRRRARCGCDVVMVDFDVAGGGRREPGRARAAGGGGRRMSAPGPVAAPSPAPARPAAADADRRPRRARPAARPAARRSCSTGPRWWPAAPASSPRTRPPAPSACRSAATSAPRSTRSTPRTGPVVRARLRRSRLLRHRPRARRAPRPGAPRGPPGAVVRSRSPSPASACRGTTRSSSPPTAATPARALAAARAHPKVAILTAAGLRPGRAGRRAARDRAARSSSPSGSGPPRSG